MPSTVLFETDDASVEVNGPNGDQPYTPLPQVVTGLSQSGERYVYRTNSSDKRQWTLTFDFVTEAQKQGLDWFYAEVVGGPAEEFSYRDTEDVERTVRFVNTNLPWQRQGPNQWSVVVTLEFTEPATAPGSSSA